ncbi:MAG: hypothetical protein GXY76_03640 [Chloroflexi bacterium]|nr:hypothetical protein [Chloroflexota bacterium]
MAIDVTPLFQPLCVRGKTLRNRIVMPPMVVLHGLTRPSGIEWYARRARGGAALVIIESTAANRFVSELTAENLKPLVEGIHHYGALAAIQLSPITRGSRVSPADLDRQQIESIVCHYRIAAQTCVEAGFDGVEPHGAHGYLLNQFFSPEQNRRADEYGGDLENRMRLALRIVREIRPILGPHRLLLYRHTPVGPGYGIAESVTLAKRLVAEGVDILDISPSSIEAPGDRAAPFRGLGAPVIAVNNLDDPGRAVEALAAGRADLIAVGRGLIADPEWPNKVREGRLGEVVACIQCDQGCHGNLDRGEPVACTQWPKGE